MAVQLTASQLEYLLLNLEACSNAASRTDFYLCVQGVLQALVPHRMLLCALGAPGQGVYEVVTFAPQPIASAVHEDLVRPTNGLLALAMAEWRAASAAIWRAAVGGETSTDVGLRLLRDGFSNVAGHGIVDHQGHTIAFFLFFDLGATVREACDFFIRLMVPQLHAALGQILSVESIGRFRPVRSTDALSDREAEVLRLIQAGCINEHIAKRLGISPLTVKNHVQGILRKLHAQNRAQAVAAAIARGLIRAELVSESEAQATAGGR